MSHEISVVNGLAEAMYANEPAWHGLGEVFDPGGSEAPTSEQVYSKILNWQVRLEPVEFWCESLKSTVVVPDQFVTVRSDIEGPQAALGVVGKNYTVVQNREAFDFLDSLAKEGAVRYESAMALKGGKLVVLLARLPTVDTVIAGDEHLRYVMFSTSHDGSAAIQAMPTSVRVVCANTLAVALSKDGNLSYRIKHNSNVGVKLEKAKRYLSQFDQAFTLYNEKARTLATRNYSGRQLLQYLDQLFMPELGVGEEMTKHQQKVYNSKVDIVRACLNSEANNLKGMKGTWWQLFNAITEAIDHGEIFKYRGEEKDERKFLNVMNGEGSDLKLEALELAMRMS